MSDTNGIIRIYSGQEVTVLFLKGELEKHGIATMMKNDFQSGITAGFGGGLSETIDLFIEENDLVRAEPILTAFIKDLENNNKTNE